MALSYKLILTETNGKLVALLNVIEEWLADDVNNDLQYLLILACDLAKQEAAVIENMQ